MDRGTTLKKLLLGSSLSLLGGNLLAYQPTEFKLKRVVLDAGHGGKDPGTVGKKSRVKDVVLSLALQVGKFINEILLGVEVIYTRKTVVFVELKDRANIANRNKADLFVTIHCNATRTPSVYGTETFV